MLILDLAKSWHLIHFLLTGEALGGRKPLADAVLGGTDLSTEDVGYGPARYLSEAEVSAVAKALSPISFHELWANLDCAKAIQQEVYPGCDGSAEEREYIGRYFSELQAFCSSAAANRQAVILFVV
jgi:hypothetical protein